MADYKAVSINLMHADVRVIDSVYAPLASAEVRQRIAGLTSNGRSSPDNRFDSYSTQSQVRKARISWAVI
jgi:hypothetical protein